ncbi:MAG: nicotinate-nucleotide--dimethylbenzimidazole phosphoribosyltransferase [Lachnospiraceae bacterium]|nr:nicotinate-nucleotide--dimethylbenzimidazole phosphoribosyltransferase [Lachnospiraceae bacterium]
MSTQIKESEQMLRETIGEIGPLNACAMKLAKERQAKLAKPPGSLGKLEDISVRLAGITGSVHNRIEKKRIIVLCADNGVTKEGVSSAPASVTLSQAVNMTRGKTGMSCLAAEFGDEVQVVDVGIAAAYRDDHILNCRIREGTENIRVKPAMLREEVLRAVLVGIELAGQAKREGCGVVGVGEMGIGNTTTSSAVLSVLTGRPVEEVTGRGGGLTDSALQKKCLVIREAVRLHMPDPADVIDVLTKVGGLDLAAMCGVFLGCARERIPVVIDGLISVTAALCAARLSPQSREFFFASHVSAEPGYRAACGQLRLEPPLFLDMRLGEGSGCPLMFEVLRAACTVMNDMATFEEAAINDSYLDGIRECSAEQDR